MYINELVVILPVIQGIHYSPNINAVSRITYCLHTILCCLGLKLSNYVSVQDSHRKINQFSPQNSGTNEQFYILR